MDDAKPTTLLSGDLPPGRKEELKIQVPSWLAILVPHLCNGDNINFPDSALNKGTEDAELGKCSARCKHSIDATVAGP